MTDSSPTTSCLSQAKAGEVELMLYWSIKDRDFMHRIQDYFGMSRYLSVNYMSPINISPDNPKYQVLLEGEEKGFYRICRLPKRQ